MTLALAEVVKNIKNVMENKMKKPPFSADILRGCDGTLILLMRLIDSDFFLIY